VRRRGLPRVGVAEGQGENGRPHQYELGRGRDQVQPADRLALTDQRPGTQAQRPGLEPEKNRGEVAQRTGDKEQPAGDGDDQDSPADLRRREEHEEGAVPARLVEVLGSDDDMNARGDHGGSRSDDQPARATQGGAGEVGQEDRGRGDDRHQQGHGVHPVRLDDPGRCGHAADTASRIS